jgi:DNA-binding NtrC family response regulator
VTLVTDEQLPLGLLSFPKGSRTSPVTLEEAIAARELCDRLSAVISLSSTIARSRRRESEARERADELVVEAAKLEAIIELSSRPRDYVLETLAAGAQVAAYSARARAALSDLTRLALAGSDVALEVPVGIDVHGYAAFVHVSGARRGGPFIIVDGTAAAAHDPAQYRPGGDGCLERARAGTLVVLNVASLPLVAQDALAVALSERSSASGGQGVPFSLVASLPKPAAELLEARQVSRALGQFLIPNAVALPTLIERPEDLRGLILEALCKSGVRFAGQTLGIEPRALSLLIDHPWPGNVRELSHVVESAARAATGERVRVADLEAVGFTAGSPAVTAPASSAPASRVGPGSDCPSSSPERPAASLIVARPRGDGSDGALSDDDEGGEEQRSEPRIVRRRRRR